MCELFAMSSRNPTPVTYSLEEFARNGSELRHNRDGWGIAMVRDRDAYLVKEPAPAVDSPWAQFIAAHPVETTMAIAHVRHATRGIHTMENTHPFRRAFFGGNHLFAHNGTLEDMDEHAANLIYVPVGETDSELAFCTLLSRLKPLYEAHARPTLEARFAVFRDVCDEMKNLGSCNFLYHDGEVLLVHAHKRIYEENGELVGPKPPGLHMKRCWTCSFQKEITSPGLKVDLCDYQTVLLASVPLDEHGWEALPEGTVLALKEGEILAQA